MKILITGAAGQLGNHIIYMLNRNFSDIGKIDEMYRYAELLCTDKNTLDITSLKKVRQVLNTFKPDILINTVAYTNVDGCETNSDLAFKVNSLGAKNLAVVCEELNSKIIHISTDYVFDGDSNIPYREYDLPNPVSIYGKTKYLGEEYVKQFCSRYFIVRTSWLYGGNGKNFVNTIIKVSRKKEVIEVVDDQIGTPTNVEDLAYHVLKIASTDNYGIYHCTGNGKCSWYDFACRIIDYIGINCRVHATKSNKLERAAKRPSFSLLDNMMLRCTVGDEMRNWKDALFEFINKKNN